MQEWVEPKQVKWQQDALLVPGYWKTVLISKAVVARNLLAQALCCVEHSACSRIARCVAAQLAMPTTAFLPICDLTKIDRMSVPSAKRTLKQS